MSPENRVGSKEDSTPRKCPRGGAKGGDPHFFEDLTTQIEEFKGLVHRSSDKHG